MWPRDIVMVQGGRGIVVSNDVLGGGKYLGRLNLRLPSCSTRSQQHGARDPRPFEEHRSQHYWLKRRWG